MTSPAVSPGVMELDSCAPAEKCVSFQQEPNVLFLYKERRFAFRLTVAYNLRQLLLCL